MKNRITAQSSEIAIPSVQVRVDGTLKVTTDYHDGVNSASTVTTTTGNLGSECWGLCKSPLFVLTAVKAMVVKGKG